MEYVQTHTTNKQGVQLLLIKCPLIFHDELEPCIQAWEKMEIKFLLNFTQHGWVDGPERALKWQVLGLGTQLGSETALLTFSSQRIPLSCFRGRYSCLTSRSISTILFAQQYFWWAISADECCRHSHRYCFHFLLQLLNRRMAECTSQPYLLIINIFGMIKNLGTVDQQFSCGKYPE